MSNNQSAVFISRYMSFGSEFHASYSLVLLPQAQDLSYRDGRAF
jgi:hypothetical protein